MCTVTFVPQKRGYILTSNRDEAPQRSPQEISHTTLYQQSMIFPRDTQAGGTWIAASDKNRVICVLNGAFRYHKHEPPYRKSRGLMLLEAFEYQSLVDFIKNYDFCKIEPFTLILCEQRALTELRWDGSQKYVQVLDPKEKHLWASATLYSAEAIKKRRQWFEQWQRKLKNPGSSQIIDFHKYAGEGDPWNDVVMNRGGLVQTVSITQVANDHSEIRMDYHDLLNDNLKQAKITLEGEVVEST